MRNHIRIAAICSVVFTGFVQAATLTVGVGVGYDYGSVQAAINAAKAGDTVVVAPGTYADTAFFLGKNIILTSTDPNKPYATTLEAIGGRQSIVVFSGSEGPACVLRGFRITRGHYAGIRGNATKATIASCVIEGNSGDGSEIGGGISDCDGLIENCWIEGNSADEFGGGLYDCDGKIVGCTIVGNSCGNDRIAGSGGGLYGCDGTIDDCTIQDNSATGDGGGFYGCDGSITGCMISGNTAVGSGGGLCECRAAVSDCAIILNQSTAWHGGAAARCTTVTGCTISENLARGYGGALFDCNMVSNCTIRDNSSQVYPGGGLSHCGSVANCTVSGNRAAQDGGGLYECRTVSNCTVIGNLAGGKGGAFYHSDYFGMIRNSILWDNRASVGNEVYVACAATPPETADYWSMALSYSDIQGGREAVCLEGDCRLTWDPCNFDKEPGFVRPGRWSAQTWQAGDYHLLLASPCVNAGDPNADYSGQTDIDGEPRVFKGRVDMGADECTTTPALLTGLRIFGPNEVPAGSSVQLRATAYYTDGSHADATSAAAWSVEPQGFAAIDEHGLFTLSPALSEPTEVVVHAVYTDGEITLDASKPVRCIPKTLKIVYHVDNVHGSDDSNGLTVNSAFATIQKGIDAAKDGDTVLVYPGVYTQEIRFKGKAITLQSADDPAVLRNPGDFAVSLYYGEGPGSVLKNFIIKDSLTGIFVAAGSPTISNITVVMNGYGIEAYAGAQPDVRNCIFWNNSEADVVGCSPQYSCLQRITPGPGNISSDPLFADSSGGDYHLRSAQGRYWPRYDVWVLDEVTSPCINAGDPSSPVGREPSPNGGRINMGAYGGTSQASRFSSRR